MDKGITLRGIVKRIVCADFSYAETIYDSVKKGPVKRWVLLLPGGGCAWAKKSGGCYMCGFSRSTRRKIPSAFFLKFAYFLGWRIVKKESVSNLTIFNGGSFLNNEEIPLDFQIYIARKVAENSRLEQLMIESRPEFVTPEKIQLLQKTLSGKTLQVGIGLEVQDDRIRNRCVHKGFSRRDYEKTVRFLKERKARVLTYVFLKPIYLTEQEAIDEAIRTIKYAFEVGSDTVALECALVQEGTKLCELYQQGQYRPPWLWSVLEVVRESYHLGYVHVGRFWDEPPPIDGPRNCDSCTPKALELFDHYRQHHDLTVFEGFDCQCRGVWRASLNKT